MGCSCMSVKPECLIRDVVHSVFDAPEAEYVQMPVLASCKTKHTMRLLMDEATRLSGFSITTCTVVAVLVCCWFFKHAFMLSDLWDARVSLVAKIPSFCQQPSRRFPSGTLHSTFESSGHILYSAPIITQRLRKQIVSLLRG